MGIDKKRRRGRNSSEKRTDPSDNVDDYKEHSVTLIRLDDDAPTWFTYGMELPGRDDTNFTDKSTRASTHQLSSVISKYRSMGDRIYQREIQLASQGVTKPSDDKWVENTMRKGTLKDRIAAMSVTVSADPIHKFYALDGLLAMVGCSESGGKTNSRVAQATAEALEDLFTNTFLPPNRKLVDLSNRPLLQFEKPNIENESKKTLSPRLLLLWRFEEMVKEKYELYLQRYMASTLQDAAESHKVATLQSAAVLLSSVPEGESVILSMIVNKLGDPGKKVVAASGHQLRTVIQQHPNMQTVIAREVQQLAHRPHLSSKALYNCIVFLNQLKLEKAVEGGTSDLPVSLITTYFRLFEVAVKPGKKGKHKDDASEETGMKSRLLSALLTGVNRAHPYLPEENQDMEEHIDALYKVVHTAGPAASTQSLMLLFHLSIGSKQDKGVVDKQRDNGRQDRFYRALYATMSKPVMIAQGKHLTMYFNLVYKALKHDTETNRVIAMAKRLVSTVLHSDSPPIAGCMFLLSEVSKVHDKLRQCMEELPNEKSADLVFDDLKRDPQRAISSKTSATDETEADKTQLCHLPSWELSLVAHHFHPSVKKFVASIGAIEYAGDPLKDLSLAPFLDKFSYRNPKSQEKVEKQLRRGESIAERRNGRGTIQARLGVPLNDPAFLEQEEVEAEDEFFRRFFVERARRDEIKGVVRGKQDDPEDEEVEEAEDEALDKAEGAEGWDTGKSFEEFERVWETDEEEEAFVDSLAEKLIEDASQGLGDLEDEDPDTGDWGDLYSDADDSADDAASDDISDDESGNEMPISNEGLYTTTPAPADVDGFMDDSDAGADDSEGDDAALAFALDEEADDDQEEFEDQTTQIEDDTHGQVNREAKRRKKSKKTKR